MGEAVGYRLVGEVVMLAHFGFLAFVVLGGLLAWRWPWVVWPHLVAVLWGFATVAFSIRCPLTDVEDWARVRAGEEPLRGTGFIDNYIEGVLYPERYTRELQVLVAVAVLVSWVGFAWRMSRRRVSAPPR